MLCLILLFCATSSCILELADDVSYLFLVATKVDVRFNGGYVHVCGDRIQSMVCNSFNVFSNFDVRLSFHGSRGISKNVIGACWWSVSN